MTEMAPILSRRRSAARPIAAFVWLLGASAGCSDDPATQDGMETGPCIQGACLTGLVCLSDVCVAPDAGSGGSGDDGGMTLPGTGPDPTASPTTTADTTAGDPTVAVDGTGCTGECRTEVDCAPGQTCEDCTCVGAPPSDTGDTGTGGPNDSGSTTSSAEDTVGPCEPSGQGVYADCLEAGTAACGSDPSTCLGDLANGTTCIFPCDDVCDCPPAPAGSEVTCDTAVAGSDDTYCFLDCSRGQPCPPGAACLAGNGCVFADTIVSYGDCVNESGVCEDSGICVVDDLMASGSGVCSPPCRDASDCMPPPSGATPTCTELSNGVNACTLVCDESDECPVGMFCHPTFATCMWALDGIPTYDACEGATELCDQGAGCWVLPAAAPTHSACGFDCESSADCPPAPSGTAVPTCYDVGETSCFLDCSNGETCPAGSDCVGDPGQTLICMWPV